MSHTKEPVKCCKQVYPPGMNYPKAKPCKRMATMERNGNHYCAQHDPEAVKARDEKQRQKWNEESKARQELFRRQNACINALAFVPAGKEQEAMDAVRQALNAIQAAHSNMFEQSMSNPIRNAWGKEISCTLLNEAHCKAREAATLLGIK